MEDPLDEGGVYLRLMTDPPARVEHERQARAYLQHHETQEHFREQDRLPWAIISGVTYTTTTFARMCAMSVMDVTRPLASDTTSTVCSKMLGVVSDDEGQCHTCFSRADLCQGHYGVIRFARPVLCPSNISKLCAVLNLFCHVCCHARFHPNELDAATLAMSSSSARWERMAQGIGSSCRCTARVERVAGGEGESASVCGAFPLKYQHLTKKTSANTIRLGKVSCGAADLLQHVRRLRPPWAAYYTGFQSAPGKGPRPAEDLALLESKFFLEGVLVPPRRSRPDKDAKSRHFTTLVYDNIVRKNIALQTALDSDEKDDIQSRETDLYSAVSELASSTVSARPQASKGAAQRQMDRKDGGPRGRGLPKRNDFSARAVATPGPYNRPDEIILPVVMRAFLTPRVRVAPYNIAFLRQLQARGEITKIMIGRRRVPERLLKTFRLKPGMYVRRYMVKGDQVNSVRPPTLTPQGMMVFFVAGFTSSLTLQVPVMTHLIYGGDFDGDCKAEFALFDMLARAEATLINTFKYMPTSRVNGKPIAGPHFNAPVATYYWSSLLTIPRNAWEACMATVADYPPTATLPRRLRLHGVPVHSGRALASAMLPDTLTYGNGSFIVRDGVLVKGVWTVDTLREVMLFVLAQYGFAAVQEYIHRTTIMADVYMEYHMVSVGYEDMHLKVLDEHQRPLIPDMVKDLERRVEALYERDMRKEDREEHVTMEITNFSNAVHTNVQRVLQGSTMMDLTNAKVSKMANNSTFIIGVVGQQYLREARMEHGYVYGAPNGHSPSLVSRGFIKSSFSDGLTPEEYLHQARTARRSQVDQNSTSAPGELSTHIERAVDNLVVSETRAVTLTDGGIVQYEYGGDALSPIRSWTTARYFRSPFNIDMTMAQLMAREGFSGAVLHAPVGPPDEMQLAIHEGCALNDLVRNEAAAAHRFNPNLGRHDDARPVILTCPDPTAALAALRDNAQGCPPFGVGGHTAIPPILHRLFVEQVAADGGYGPLEQLTGLVCAEHAVATALWGWRNIWVALRPQWPADPRPSLLAAVVAVAGELHAATNADPVAAAPPLHPAAFAALFVPATSYDTVAQAALVARDRAFLPTATASIIPPALDAWASASRKRSIIPVDPAAIANDALGELALHSTLARYVACATVLERLPLLAFFEQLGLDGSAPEVASAAEQELEARVLRADLAFAYALYRRCAPAGAKNIEAMPTYPARLAATSAREAAPSFRRDCERRLQAMFVTGGTGWARIETPTWLATQSGPGTTVAAIAPLANLDLCRAAVQACDRFSSKSTNPNCEEGRELAAQLVQRLVYELAPRAPVTTHPTLVNLASERLGAMLRDWWRAVADLHSYANITTADGLDARPRTAPFAFEQAVFITMHRAVHGSSAASANSAYWESTNQVLSTPLNRF